ncbi:MAG TPA: hypothetical protein VFJ97_14720 [Dermatophilaceae bacterium]|nr:hypothetical protein [Dermatophilaceae bacterium]
MPFVANPPRRAARLAAAVIAAAAATASAAGCTAGSGQSGGTVTVTVTPTVTVSTPVQTPSIPASSPALPTSAVKGRAFDFGSITKVARDGGVDVLAFDRWTVNGMADAALARDGLVLRPHTDSPYSNQNSRTYAIPVRADAAFTYRHCLSADLPVTAESVGLPEMAALRGAERLMLLTLDGQGWVTRGENDPACP